MSKRQYNFKDETGNKYGRLTVIKQSGLNKYSQVAWECLCDCGNTVRVSGILLRKGTTRSCGCLASELKSARSLKEETGNTHGMLTVVRYFGIKNHEAAWECKCECGNTTVVIGSKLRSGATKSCGCKKAQWAREANMVHGRAIKSEKQDPLYKLWCSMRQRCTNANEQCYKYYGGRGITVCEEWMNAFVPFMNWALSNGYKHGLQIDRKDNDGNYNPNNCHFVTQKENCRNRRNNTFIEYKGETKTIAEWGEILEIDARNLSNRISYGWSIERAFTQPLRKSHNDMNRSTAKYFMGY